MSTLTANFEKHFPRGITVHAAFNRPTDRFSVTVLFGPSGSGKSTILRCLAGLERPQRGSIHYAGHTWLDAAARIFVPPQRRGIGFLFQDYALFPHLTVAANVAYALHALPRHERHQRVRDMLELLQLTGLENRYPHQISGGEQQRVALARALVLRPRLLLLDEPLSALDEPTREHLRRQLRRLLSQFPIPCFLVTHDRLEALALGDFVTVLDRGIERQSGPVHEVFSRPADAFVARLAGIETITPARVLHAGNGLLTLAIGEGADGAAVGGGGGGQLLAVAPEPPTPDVLVCIRGEDVTLQTGTPEHTSARNRLPGRITALTTEGPIVRVELHCGFPLVAITTKPAAEELQLHPGTPVTAIIKASAIHVLSK
jgi:molybdate transport system ATP-binding protein